MSFERDNRVSSFEIKEDGYDLSLDYYLHSYYGRGPIDVQLINVDSRIKAYLLIFVDGEQLCRLVVGEGVQHIPLRITAEEYVNVYVRPHEDVQGEHRVTEVQFDLI